MPTLTHHALLRLLPLVLCVTPVLAQDDPLLEGRLLRSAASLESRGEFVAAETVLQELMVLRPTSTGALFALERVLRLQGRLADVLEQVDVFLLMEPQAAEPHILKMRVFVDEDDQAALLVAAREWMSADPESPHVYREVARAYGPAFGNRSALRVLLAGREAVGDGAAFAMEIGDLHRDLGEPHEAVAQWSRAVGEDGGQVAAVIRRLQDLPGNRAELARPLIETLADPEGSVARRRAGARIALDVGSHDRALSIARNVAPELSGQTRRGFLADLARRAQDADAYELVLWAYLALREAAATGSESRALDQRIAQAALATADTARAVKAWERVVQSFSPGSTERRPALSELTRLFILQDPHEGRRRLSEFRKEFAAAPELDPLAVMLASRFQFIGEPDEAQDVLAGITGPGSSLERAYLEFGRGEIETGMTALGEALPGLPAADVTEVIALLDLMGRLEEPVRSEVARLASLARQGRGAEAVDALRAGAASGWAEAGAILAFGARMAHHSGDDAVAAELWRRLLDAHPGATEVPEGTLALARLLARTPAGAQEAERLLENLILARPDNPLVPSARRELDRLHRKKAGR